MRNLVFFLLGPKGLEVLKAAICSGFNRQGLRVIVGKDHQVHEDCHEEIVKLCDQYGIFCCERTEFKQFPVAYEDCLAFAAGWRWIIDASFRQLIVFHDSLLPKYRGFNPLVTCLLCKESEVGVTAIIANDEFDRGDIVGSRSMEITYPVKIAEVIKLVSGLYFDLAEHIFKSIEGSAYLKGEPQDETKATYSVWRDDDDYRIDWSWPADKILHFINCVSYPYKNASTISNGKLIRIIEADVVSDVDVANRDVGKVLFVIDGKPVVICGTGLLKIIEAVDDEGRSELPLKKFRSRFK